MADEIVSPVASATPVIPVQTVSPTVEAVVSTPQPLNPVAETTAAQSPTPEVKAETPAPTTAIGAELAKLANEPTVKEIVQAAEGAELAKEAEPQSVEPAPVPTYEAFKLPEGVSFDSDRLGVFTGLLAEAESAKGDHAKMQEFGQKLMDQHIEGIQAAIKNITDANAKVKDTERSGWKAAFEADPEIGGKKKETTLNAVNAVLAMASTLDPTTGAPYADAKVKSARMSELGQLMESGIGDHPALIRTFSNINKIISDKNKIIADLRTKYESEANVQMVPGTKPSTTSKSAIERRYGAKK